MNGLLKRLLVLMEKKIAHYEIFISLLQDEWRYIAEYSIDALEASVSKKNDLAYKMQILESERTRIMKKIAHELKISLSGLTMKRLISIQKSPINPRLAKSRKKLLKQIHHINELHRSIRTLMDQSTLSFRKSMVFLHSEGEMASSPYHANGRLAEAKIHSRMLSLDA